jgi:hypothetical protein
MEKNKMSKFFSVIGISVIIILVIAVGFIVNKKLNPAGGLSLSLFTHSQCVDKKCVIIDGAGQNQCSNDNNCLVDPTEWCKSHNVADKMVVDAIRYPNGNFSCDCYYLNKDKTHSQTPCFDSHLQ